MFIVTHATKKDIYDYFQIDKHLPKWEYESKIRDKRCYIIGYNKKTIGVMRYNLLFDSIPFLTLIFVDKPYRNKGFGKQALQFWEKEMGQLGHKMVITSTQIDEEAQHFYRKLGYIDKGGLFLDNTPFEQPQELFMVKVL